MNALDVENKSDDGMKDFFGQIRATLSAHRAVAARIREANPIIPTQPKCETIKETSHPLAGNKIGKGARLILPAPREYTYGRDHIRSRIEDEEILDYEVALSGYHSKTLPSKRFWAFD
jgi:hypothetical protein